MQELQNQEARALNVEDLMTRCMGNIEFAEHILATFQALGDEALADLEQAMAAEDAESLSRLAHRLKGASANVAAPGLQAHAEAIERAARQSSLEEIPAHIENLRHEWSRFASTPSLPELLSEAAS